MDFIPVNVDALPLYATHYFFTFPDGRYRECIHCGAIFDMPSAGDERCRRHEAYLRLDGDPDRSMGTH